MAAHTVRKIVEVIGTALLGAGCVLVYPLARRWNKKPVRVLISGAAGEYLLHILGKEISIVCVGSLLMLRHVSTLGDLYNPEIVSVDSSRENRLCTCSTCCKRTNAWAVHPYYSASS